jgi:hypothetical protein
MYKIYLWIVCCSSWKLVNNLKVAFFGHSQNQFGDKDSEYSNTPTTLSKVDYSIVPSNGTAKSFAELCTEMWHFLPKLSQPIESIGLNEGWCNILDLSMRNWPISARIKVKSRYQSNDVAMGRITVTPGSKGNSGLKFRMWGGGVPGEAEKNFLILLLEGVENPQFTVWTMPEVSGRVCTMPEPSWRSAS